MSARVYQPQIISVIEAPAVRWRSSRPFQVTYRYCGWLVWTLYGPDREVSLIRNAAIRIPVWQAITGRAPRRAAGRVTLGSTGRARLHRPDRVTTPESQLDSRVVTVGADERCYPAALEWTTVYSHHERSVEHGV